MTGLLADCDHFIAGAAMIGGISYFHTYAYDLLATNERIIAASCDAAIAAHRGVLRRGERRAPGRAAAEGHVPVVLDGLRERRRVALLRGAAAGDTAAAVVLRLPETSGGVLRPGRLGAVQASLYARAPVQLRGHRREPCPRRRGDPVRERRARHEPRRSRP